MDTYERALAYLEKLDPAVSGGGGHNQTLRAACELFRFGLSDSEAARALEWFNANRCQPPWKAHELRHKLNDARAIVAKAGQTGRRVASQYKTRQRLQWVAPPPPVRRPRPKPPVIQRSEAEEDAWWLAVFAARGITDPALEVEGTP